MKTRRGISLITLVITIVIIVILAVVVVLNITKSNPLNNASEAVFKENVSSYRDELEIYKGNQYIKDFTFNEEEMNYPSSDIDQVIKSMDKKDKEKFVISKGQLCYNGDDEQEKEWARELGIEITSSVIIGLDTAVNKNSVTLNVNVREGNNYTYTYEIIDVEKIEDITEKTYTFNNLTLNKKYIAKVIVKYNGNEEELSKEFTTSQDFDLEITSENLEVNLFEDTTTTFTATSYPNATYKWYYNDTEIAGETSNAYSISTSDMDANNYTGGKYKVEVTLDGITQTAEAIQVVKPLEISTANELKSLATRVNAQGITFENDTITQTQDIDLSLVCSESLGSFEPIGKNSSTSFNGTYDGNYNIIDNLYIKDGSYKGLFSYNKGTIKNIILQHCYIDVALISGGIVAWNQGNVERCVNELGSIIISNAESRSGGIVGANYSGTVKECINHSAISGAGSHIGGIVGFNGWESGTTGGKIISCYNTGEVSSYNYGGGIAGCSYIGDVCDSYSVGNVTVTGTSIGGICGAFGTGTIENCYYNQESAKCGMEGTDVVGSAEPKTGTFMKSSEFVNLLGGASFKLVAGKNKGYPVLSFEEGTSINVDNYDIYYYGTISKDLVENAFENWGYKGTITFNENCINFDTSANKRNLNILHVKDEIDLSKYNTIVIKKENAMLSRFEFITENVDLVNNSTIAFNFESGNAVLVEDNTYVCDVNSRSDVGVLSLTAYNKQNDGNIYEVYLSTKTLEQIQAEYNN